MMNFSWKFLTPIAIVILVVTAIVEKALEQLSSGQVLPVIRISTSAALNLLLALIILVLLRKFAQERRQRVGEERQIAQPSLEARISSAD
jgi:uncharacterized membrane protein